MPLLLYSSAKGLALAIVFPDKPRIALALPPQVDQERLAVNQIDCSLPDDVFLDAFDPSFMPGHVMAGLVNSGLDFSGTIPDAIFAVSVPRGQVWFVLEGVTDRCRVMEASVDQPCWDVLFYPYFSLDSDSAQVAIAVR